MMSRTMRFQTSSNFNSKTPARPDVGIIQSLARTKAIQSIAMGHLKNLEDSGQAHKLINGSKFTRRLPELGLQN